MNFESIIQYLSSINSDFMNIVKPSSEEEILELKSSIPESYKIFLLSMGNDLGGLRPLNAEFELPKIISAKKNYTPPERYLLIGVQNEFPYLDVYFDLNSVKNQEDSFQIVRFESIEPIEQIFPAFPTLEDMVLFEGFKKFGIDIAAFKHRLVPAGIASDEFRKNRISILKDICFYLELTKLNGMSDLVACYEKDDFWLQVYSPNILSFSIEIASSNQKVLIRYSEIISERLKLVKQLS